MLEARSVRMALLVVVITLGSPLAVARADDSGPVRVPPSVPPSTRTAEAIYNEGLTFAKQQDWARAAAAHREAVRLRPAFPEAWNGLGHALRQQKKYDESVRAYQEALRLRPNYAHALEYLGEAYVQMGRLEEARAILARLRPLDPKEAEELARAIDGAARR